MVERETDSSTSGNFIRLRLINSGKLVSVLRRDRYALLCGKFAYFVDETIGYERRIWKFDSCMEKKLIMHASIVQVIEFCEVSKKWRKFGTREVNLEENPRENIKHVKWIWKRTIGVWMVNAWCRMLKIWKKNVWDHMERICYCGYKEYWNIPLFTNKAFCY